MPDHWSRRQLVQGAGAVGLGLLAGCGRPMVAAMGIKLVVNPPRTDS
jgi:hypothetical protein